MRKKLFKSGFKFRGVIFLVLFLVPLFTAAAEEEILASYERSFMRAGLAGKSRILLDASGDERAPEFIGALYDFALKFILEHGRLFSGDPDMINLCAGAARGAAASGNLASAETLWRIFLIFHDSYSRVEILKALSMLGGNNSYIIQSVNEFLAARSINTYAGISVQIPDYPVIEAAVSTLASIGNGSSYSALFSILLSPCPEQLAAGVNRAMEEIPGDLKRFLTEVILTRPPAEKLAAFKTAVESRNFSGAEKGAFAEAALETALGLSQADSGALALRYAAVETLGALKWTKARALVIRHYHLVQADFTSNKASGDRLIEAVACLGVMGDSESARALALQLGYFNSAVEKGGGYDERVILAIVNTLGEIGDKAAFDNLFYMGYLNYTERIKAAAKEALERLRW